MVVVAGSAGPCCWQGGVPSRLLSLQRRCSSRCCVLTRPFLCVLPSLVFLLLLTRTQGLPGQGPTLMTSLLALTTSLKAHLLTQSHGVGKGAGLQHMNFGGDMSQPIELLIEIFFKRVTGKKKNLYLIYSM